MAGGFARLPKTNRGMSGSGAGRRIDDLKAKNHHPKK
jgi:hypothetical protein